MNSSNELETDDYVYDPRQAAAANVLRERFAGHNMHEYLSAARDLLIALGEFNPAPDSTLSWVPATLMTAEQEIRARALDSAARLLGPTLADLLSHGPFELIAQTAIEEWERAAHPGRRYIETGSFHGTVGLTLSAEPTPPQNETGAAPTQA